MILHDQLARALSYPDATYKEDVTAIPALGEFAARIRDFRPGELEELFTQTFDLNPACSLEVGWHLFGENYERGSFLVKMRQELRRYGLSESTELPDHLTHVLAVLGRMEPAEAAEFAGAFVLRAVEKMLAALEGKGNPYEIVLKQIHSVVQAQAAMPAPQGVEA